VSARLASIVPAGTMQPGDVVRLGGAALTVTEVRNYSGWTTLHTSHPLYGGGVLSIDAETPLLITPRKD